MQASEQVRRMLAATFKLQTVGLTVTVAVLALVEFQGGMTLSEDKRSPDLPVLAGISSVAGVVGLASLRAASVISSNERVSRSSLPIVAIAILPAACTAVLAVSLAITKLFR